MALLKTTNGTLIDTILIGQLVLGQTFDISHEVIHLSIGEFGVRSFVTFSCISTTAIYAVLRVILSSSGYKVGQPYAGPIVTSMPDNDMGR